jgi:fibronectin type 3 domain-containing protein
MNTMRKEEDVSQRKRVTGWLPAIALVLLMLALAGCGGGGDDGSGSSTPPPAQPSGVTVTAETAQATVSWTAVAGATSYNVYYSATAGVTKSNATNSVTNVTGTTTTVSNLIDGTPYYFIVTAVDASGESAASSEVSAIPLEKPRGNQVTAGDGKVTVSWTAAAGATSYNIYYSTAAGQETTASGVKFPNATSPQVITGLINGTTYYFVVTAVNDSGESSVSSEKSATPAAAPQPPPSPTGVTVASTAAGEVTVSWNAVIGATSYNVYYLQSSSQPTTADVIANGAEQSTTSSPLTVTGLTSGATYWFTVTAMNAAGESGGQTSPKKIVVQ